jgi:hypothetical protein
MMVAHLAGPLAEFIAYGSFDLQRSERDFSQALDFARLVEDCDEARAVSLCQDFRSFTLTLLQNYWHPVMAVADTLTQRKTLSGDEFRRVFGMAQLTPISAPLPVPPASEATDISLSVDMKARR